MSLPKNLNAYKDIVPVLEAAINAGGARLEFEQKKQAIHWRARAYMYRRLMQEKQGHTRFDRLTLSLQETQHSCEVIMTLDEGVGILKTLKGEPLSTEDPLQAEARKVLNLIEDIE